MSLVTRGLGDDSKLVTAGLGGDGVIEFIGCVIVRTLTATSSVAKSIGLSTMAEMTSNLAGYVGKTINLSGRTNLSANLTSSVSKDLSCH
jgi:hypothetical protein